MESTLRVWQKPEEPAIVLKAWILAMDTYYGAPPSLLNAPSLVMEGCLGSEIMRSMLGAART